jgi:hypothetical protein
MPKLGRGWLAVAAASAFGMESSAAAHHSYAMFDGEHTKTVTGTLAKIDWTNPHVFIWLYVRNDAGAYDLYAFENGSPNVLGGRGWSKATFAVGETLAVRYWPLRDGRPGGHFAVATRADGTFMRAAGGPGGAVDASSVIEPPPAPPASAK